MDTFKSNSIRAAAVCAIMAATLFIVAGLVVAANGPEVEAAVAESEPSVKCEGCANCNCGCRNGQKCTCSCQDQTPRINRLQARLEMLEQNILDRRENNREFRSAVRPVGRQQASADRDLLPQRVPASAIEPSQPSESGSDEPRQLAQVQNSGERCDECNARRGGLRRRR